MILYSVSCVGGCKQFFESENPDALQKMAEAAGWGLLPITNRYRCGACERELKRASTQEGAPPRLDVDKLKPDSIGALKELPKQEPLREGPR